MLDNIKDGPGKALDGVRGSWGRLRTYLKEVRNELTRVTWPTRKEVYATTIVVIITSIFFGVYLWTLDILLGRFVGWLFQRFGAL